MISILYNVLTTILFLSADVSFGSLENETRLKMIFLIMILLYAVCAGENLNNTNNVFKIEHIVTDARSANVSYSCSISSKSQQKLLLEICSSERCYNKSHTYHVDKPVIYISHLKPFTRYNITVSFMNTSKSKVFRTKSTVPATVSELDAYSKNETAISLRWKPPYPPTGDLEGYQLSYFFDENVSNNLEKDMNIPVIPCYLWADHHCFNLTDLEIKKNYSITIRAKNKKCEYFGRGTNVNVITQKEPSEAPYDLNINWIENDLMVYWKHPIKSNGDIQYFNITLIPEGDEENINFTVNISGRSVQYNHRIDAKYLQPSRRYRLAISANNGYSGKEAVINFTTNPTKPFADVIPKIEYKKNKTISVEVLVKNLTKLNENNVNSDRLFLLIKQQNVSNPEREKLPSLLQNSYLNLTEFQTICDFEINNLTTFYFKIGASNISHPNCLENISLQTDSTYNVTVILSRTFENKTKFKLYSKNVYIPDPRPVETVQETVQNNTLEKEKRDGHISLSEIIIPVAIIIILIIIVALITVSLLKCKIKDAFRRNTSALESQRDEFPLTSTSNISPNYYSKPVPISDFEEYVKESIKNDELERQHGLFSRGPTKPWNYGSLKENMSKNRYTNLIAYDHTRVVLEKIKGQPYSDYINANYIDGYKVPKAYIATQGPTASTINDFWRMIWQKNLHYIIMLANLQENGKKKVEKYWPDINKHISFGDITVQCTSNRVFAYYQHRIFHVIYGNQLRTVNQFHYHSWPDHGVPLYPESLVPFLKQITSIPLSSKSPVVLHCSAGVGRTGTILLCDISLRMAEAKKTVDMLKNLHKLRTQRVNMVDNVEQYKLAHLVVLEYLFGEDTAIPCNEIEQKVEKLMNGEGIKRQMQYLEKNTWKDNAMRVDIKNNDQFIVQEKNRFSDIIPEYHNCIFLRCYPVSDSTSTYINAVNVDGYRTPEKFIVTQQPLPNTLGDFWRLVYEKEISLIVSLNEINLDDPSFCAFWPNSGNPTLTPVDILTLKNVNTLSLTSHDVVTVHVISRYEDKPRIVRIMSVKNWHAWQSCPERTLDLLVCLEKARTFSSDSEQVLITCYDGATASGLYTAMDFVIEKIMFEQVCDVCEAVRTVRRSRSQFVRTEEQFAFLYKAAVDFIRGFQTKPV